MSKDRRQSRGFRFGDELIHDLWRESFHSPLSGITSEDLTGMAAQSFSSIYCSIYGSSNGNMAPNSNRQWLTIQIGNLDGRLNYSGFRSFLKAS